MKVNIRRAKRRDCKKMLDLIEELAHYEKSSDKVNVSLNDFEEAGFGKDRVWEAFVAIKEEKIVGISLFYTYYSPYKGKTLHLEELIVTEGLRGNGIGRKLLERTIFLGKKRVCNRLTSQVLDWNELAINFYKKNNADFDFNSNWINLEISNY